MRRNCIIPHIDVLCRLDHSPAKVARPSNRLLLGYDRLGHGSCLAVPNTGIPTSASLSICYNMILLVMISIAFRLAKTC